MEALKRINKDTKAQSTLLFIPDISGFSKFINETEIQHSKHIIEELLQEIISANDIGLEISKIEGDAILFYRFGKAPTAAELLAQVQKMFIRFHFHLKRYENHRICNCGACRSTSGLTLKFIAHFGEVAMSLVNKQHELFGKEVIRAHRLMKNDIDHNEYALITHDLVNACETWTDITTVAWANVQHHQQEYDSATVRYCYLSLTPLMEHVPEPQVEDYGIKGKKIQVMKAESLIEAPIDMVFSVLVDFPWRSKWIPETLEKVDHINHEILQTGSIHRCFAKGPVVVTHDFKNSDDLVTFAESDINNPVSAVYTLRKVDKSKTWVEVGFFMKQNFFMKLMFSLFMKKKYLKIYNDGFVNLNQYCKDLQKSQKEHPYKIVLNPETEVLVS